MSIREIRPRFNFTVPLTPDEVVARLDAQLKRPESPCRGRVAHRHHTVDLCICDHHQHFWSPTLNLTVTDADDGTGSVVHGLVGPNPNVWTLFAMLYMGAVTLLVGATLFGLIQWWLDLAPWGMYLAPVLVLGLIVMYLVSRVGQALAAPQTATLSEFLDGTLGISHRD